MERQALSALPSLPTPSPTFSLFSWHTCLLGVASCLLMMFLISPGAAGGSLLLMGLLSALLTARGGPSSWGYVSQALLFHQVGGLRGGGEGRRQSGKPPPIVLLLPWLESGFLSERWGVGAVRLSPSSPRLTPGPRCESTCSGWTSGRTT